MERETGFEPATLGLEGRCSSQTELLPLVPREYITHPLGWQTSQTIDRDHAVQ